MALCTFMIVKMWTKWQENPAQIVLESTTTPVSAIPFPALTVCSSKKINKNRIDVEFFKKARKIVDAGELNQTEFLSMLPEE